MRLLHTKMLRQSKAQAAVSSRKETRNTAFGRRRTAMASGSQFPWMRHSVPARRHAGKNSRKKSRAQTQRTERSASGARAEKNPQWPPRQIRSAQKQTRFCAGTGSEPKPVIPAHLPCPAVFSHRAASSADISASPPAGSGISAPSIASFISPSRSMTCNPRSVGRAFSSSDSNAAYAQTALCAEGAARCPRWRNMRGYPYPHTAQGF